MIDIHLRTLLWVYCPGHAGVKRNDREDILANKATLTSALLLGRYASVEELETLHIGAKLRTSHHLSPGGQRRGKRKRLIDVSPVSSYQGTSFRSSLIGRERANVSQTNIGTVSNATFGKLLRDGLKCI